MLSIAVTRDQKQNIKSILVICTEHETWSNGKLNTSTVTLWYTLARYSLSEQQLVLIQS